MTTTAHSRLPFSYSLFGGQRNTFQFATISVWGKNDFFSTFTAKVYLAKCLRNEYKYFRFLKYFNFGLMYNIGFAAMLAEEQTFSIGSLSAIVMGRTPTKKNLVTFIH